LDIFVSKINTDGSLERFKMWYGANSKDDFGYWIDTKSRRAFSPQTEQVDKDMMIFINS
jgi:hypothetical protein